MRSKAFIGQFVAISEILAAASPLGFTIFAQLNLQWVRLLVQFAFHVTAKIEVAAMRNAFQFAELARGQEWESVFNIRRTGRVMAQFIVSVFAQAQTLAASPRSVYHCMRRSRQ